MLQSLLLNGLLLLYVGCPVHLSSTQCLFLLGVKANEAVGGHFQLHVSVSAPLVLALFSQAPSSFVSLSVKGIEVLLSGQDLSYVLDKDSYIKLVTKF